MNRISEAAADAGAIGIAGHVRPDGDCFGSSMAMYNYLRKAYPNKEISVYLEYVPEEFQFIQNSGQVKTEWDGKRFDLFIVLDCGSEERIGVAGQGFRDTENTLNIDHHISNGLFAKNNHVEPEASSTSEILCRLFEMEQVDAEIAESLYMGIVHDTGVFKHSNTTKETMLQAGELVAKGIPFSKIIDESFYRKTYLQNQLLGRCLTESVLVYDGTCIFSFVTDKIMRFYGAVSKDLDGIVDQLRITQGVEVAMLIHQTDSQEYKVSLRSNDKVDVSKIAVFFGGGGHIRAAGCSMNGSVHDVVNNLTAHIAEQLKP